MKTLASFLLISATFFAAIAYAQEPSGQPAYSSATDQISALSRAQVIAELEAAKAIGRLIFGASEALAPPAADPGLAREQVGAETAAADANRAYAFGESEHENYLAVSIS